MTTTMTLRTVQKKIMTMTTTMTSRAVQKKIMTMTTTMTSRTVQKKIMTMIIKTRMLRKERPTFAVIVAIILFAPNCAKVVQLEIPNQSRR